MTEPHDERLHAPPAIGKIDPKEYPDDLKPGDAGFKFEDITVK